MVEFRLRDGTGSIRLRYLVEDPDRHGNVRIYVRRPGHPKIRLHEKPGTDAFMAEYKAAMAGHLPAGKRKNAAAAAPDSFRWLVQQWFASGEFQMLAPSTQTMRRNFLEDLCRRPDSQGRLTGDKPFRLLESRHVRALRDERAATPSAANNMLKFLRGLFNWAVEAKHLDRNPARDVGKLMPPNRDGHHTWTPREIRQFEQRHPIGTKARLALAMLLYTGQRKSDIVLMGQTQIRDGWLHLTQQKNKGRNPITLELPMLPMLDRIIDATPEVRLQPTFLATEAGRPFSVAGFGNKFREWCDQAGLPHCSAHGLRKAMAVALAESGASEQEIMGWTGHRTSQEVTRYTKAVRQKLLAQSGAVKLIEQNTDKSVPLLTDRNKGGALRPKKAL